MRTLDRRAAGLLASLVSLPLLALGCLVEAEPTAEAASNAQSTPTLAARHVWPPRVGEAYPNLRLRNSNGERVSLDRFRGKVILVEPIGMDCPACNAFAGGNRPGAKGFQGVAPQAGLPSVEEILRDYAGGVSLSDERLVLVQLLLYAPGQQGPPSVEMARVWAEHFGFEESANATILVGEDYLIGPESYRMVPGFQLIDRDFVLRYDASGHHPRNDLYTELMPAVRSLLAEVRADTHPAGSPGG